MLGAERLVQRLVDEALGDVGVDAAAVDVREHVARGLARAEAADPSGALEGRVGLFHLAPHAIGGDLDLELDEDWGELFDVYLHGLPWGARYCHAVP